MKKVLLTIIVVMMIFTVHSTVFAQEMTLEDWTKSVVRIVAADKDGYLLWEGTGFAIGEEGKPVEYFITNNHVIDGEGEDIDIFVFRSKDHLIEAKVVVALPISDLAVIRTRDKLYGYTPFVLSDQEAEVSSHCYALGFPGAAIVDAVNELDSYAEDVTITNGIISRRTEVDGVKVYQTNTDINHGNSGGPLLNEDFEVIAVNTFRIEGAGAAMNGSVYISGVIDVLESRGIKFISSSDVKSNDDKVESSDEQIKSDEHTNYDSDQNVDTQQAQPVVEVPKVTVSQTQEIVQDSKNNVMLIIIIVAIVLLLIIIAIVASLILKGKSKGKAKGMIMGANLVMPYEVSEVPIVIGRDGSVCNIVDDAQGISRRHCTVSYVNGVFLLVDLSSNGTYLSDGTRLEKSRTYKLNHGDSFYLVDTTHSYQLSNKK